MLIKKCFIFIIILFIWISFFPQPIQEKYHSYTNIFLIIFFLTLFAKKRCAIFKSNDYPLWLFLLAISVNIFFAQRMTLALKTFLNLSIPMFSIYYLISEDFSDTRMFTLLGRAVCICSILVSLLAIFEFLFAFNFLYEYFLKNNYYKRFITPIVQPMSTQYNPTPLGSYLLGCIPFNYLLYKRGASIFKFLGAVGAIISSGVIILTLSRCGYLGLLTMATFYLFLQRKIFSLYAFVFILLILTFASPYLTYPFRGFGTNRLITRGVISNPRIERVNMATRIFKDHPFTGIGLQHFRVRFYDYYPRKNRVPYEFRIADNMYLTILAETGAIGFFGFLILICSFFKRGYSRLREIKLDSRQRWQLLVSLIGFLALLVNMAGYEFFYWTNQYLLFCIVIGCLNASLK